MSGNVFPLPRVNAHTGCVEHAVTVLWVTIYSDVGGYCIEFADIGNIL